MLIIGDVHSRTKEYLDIANSNSKTIQIGDIGFDFDYSTLPSSAKIVGGNHHNYDRLKASEAYLGDYGVYDNFFFVRGAHSPDKQYRVEGVSWWREEELTYKELYDAIDLYATYRPIMMLSHTCPKFLIPELGGHESWGTATEMALERMWELYQPRIWVFGHFHKSFRKKIEHTLFICLNELETVRI